MDSLTYLVPVETISEANQRGHWRRHHSRHARQRQAARLITQERWPRGEPAILPGTVLVITMERVCTPRRKLKDDDNLRASLKHARDGIADGLGINDADQRWLTWRYEQHAERGALPVVNVRINRIVEGEEVAGGAAK